MTAQEILWDIFSFPFGPRRFFCRSCGTFLIESTEYCSFCFSSFDEIRRTGPRVQEHPLLNQIRVRSLWSWVPGEDDELSGLIHSLKGQGAPGAWRVLARSFLSEHSSSLFRENKTYRGIIPAPSKTEGEDHAFLFAKALGELLQLPVVQPLRRLNENKQRKLGRSERIRRQNQLELKEQGQFWKFAQMEAKTTAHWILVDDILTTGATSRNMLQSLGLRESQADLWVLAVRLLAP